MQAPLSDYVKPDGTVTLHHYAKAYGDEGQLQLDPQRFGESSWSKAEKKADPTPKTFFYLDPAHKEHFFEGRQHFSTEYPAEKIYDLMKDEKKILARLAKRGGPVIQNTLKVLDRIGYHGVYYSGSFPTVAMTKKVNVKKTEEKPVQLARKPDPTSFHLNGISFYCNRPSAFGKVTWTIHHHESGKSINMDGMQFAQVLNKLPAEHSEPIRKALTESLVGKRTVVTGKLARNGYGYCGCGAPWLRHDKEREIVYCPNGHSVRRKAKAKPEKLEAQRAPQGGVIVNNQYQVGGQFLPRAFKRIRDVVAKKRKLARKEETPKSYLSIGHDSDPVKIDGTEQAWAHVRGRLLLTGEGALQDTHPDDLHGKVYRHADFMGRVDHVKKAISLSPNLGSKDQIPHVAAELKEKFPGYGVYGSLESSHYGLTKLARKEAEQVLSPEDKEIGTSAATEKKYDKLLDQSIANHPKSTLPTVDEIKSLATAGESVKGQYEHAGKVLTSFIGPENAKLFVAANAILSPLAKWEHHSRAALRVIRLWREAGSPKDPKRIHDIVERIGPGNDTGEKDSEGKKIYPSVGFYSSKAPKLRAMLQNHEEFLKRIENVADTQRGKIVEFGRAFFDPNGVPIDTHMGKALVPGAKDVQAQLTKQPEKKQGTLFEGGSPKEDLKELIRSSKTPHNLARAIAAEGNPALSSALLEAQKKLVSDPAIQKAYKVAVAEAGIQLGWEPRQVQETLWSAVVAIIAAKNLGADSSKKVLSMLRHENAFQAWNVGGLLSTPEVLKDVGILSQGHAEAFANEANKPPAATGKISPSPSTAFEAVASRIPANTKTAGAWNAVQSSMK